MLILNNRGCMVGQRVETAKRAARSAEDLVENMQVDMLVVGMG